MFFSPSSRHTGLGHRQAGCLLAGGKKMGRSTDFSNLFQETELLEYWNRGNVLLQSLDESIAYRFDRFVVVI